MSVSYRIRALRLMEKLQEIDKRIENGEYVSEETKKFRKMIDIEMVPNTKEKS